MRRDCVVGYGDFVEVFGVFVEGRYGDFVEVCGDCV